jgi:hypothetical protein
MAMRRQKLRPRNNLLSPSLNDSTVTTAFLSHEFQSPKTISRFFWRIMLWVPVVFVCWYAMAPMLHWPIRWFLSAMVLLGMPEFLTNVSQTITGFDVTTNLNPGAAAGQAFSTRAVVSTDVDARIYTYGTALFASLTIAAWHKDRWQHLWRGWLMLLPFQMLAIFAVAMKQILIDTAPAVRAQVDWAQWQFEVVAYLYQFSTLIMPPVTAVAIWLFLHRKFVEQFVGADVMALIRAKK